MTVMRRVFALSLVAFSGNALADSPPSGDSVGSSSLEAVIPADPLAAQGQELARQGEFSRAIQLFKRADAEHATSGHACLIGLVYTRRELWSQAEIFFDLCTQRATTADPTPDWLPEARRQLDAKLAEVDAAPIDVRVAPAGLAARITVSSFAPDESFAPRTIHLAPGSYVISASAPGRTDAQVAIQVTSHTAQIATLVLPISPVPPTPEQRLGTRLIYGAVGVAAVGVLFHALANNERSSLQAASTSDNPVDYQHHVGAFEQDRVIAISAYALAAAGLVTGLILRRHLAEHAPAIGGAITSGGAMLSVEWQR